MQHNYLIVEGGGFKTAFTAGILDAFIINNHNPFNNYIGVSGGAVATSYFLSQQYRNCVNAMKLLAKDQNFLDFKRTFGEQGYMDIDYLAKVAEEKVPFDIDKAVSLSAEAKVFFVATNRENGNPEYLRPIKENWLDAVVASSTLPFVTKGLHKIENKIYFDGGWSDALPVKWAYENGAKKILVLRTAPASYKSTQSWTDYFGSIYHKASPHLRETFAFCHNRYNDALDFIANPPSDLIIEQIAPAKLLKSGTYSYTKRTIMQDYRYGVDKGLSYLNSHQHMDGEVEELLTTLNV